MKNQTIKYLIWDLSGTLFKPSIYQLTDPNAITELSLLFFGWSGLKQTTPYITKALAILAELGKQEKATHTIRFHNANSLPQIIVDWLAGKIHSYDAEQLVIHNANQLFNSLTHDEAHIIKKMIKTFFDPHMVAHYMRPIEQSLLLLQICTIPKNHLYALSNWDYESFEILKKTQHAQEVFNFFKDSHIIISAHLGYVKPQPEVFEYLLKKHSLPPQQCLLIDDQQENVEEAQALGMHALHYKPDNILVMYQAFKDYNVID